MPEFRGASSCVFIEVRMYVDSCAGGRLVDYMHFLFVNLPVNLYVHLFEITEVIISPESLNSQYKQFCNLLATYSKFYGKYAYKD